MGNEDWVLKGKKLITNTKKQRLKIQRSLIFKNTILMKKNSQNYNKYMKFTLKSRVSFFFCKVIVGYKNEN